MGFHGECPRCNADLEKRDSKHFWYEDCHECGDPVIVTLGTLEFTVFPLHSGCFGYPVCSCSSPHKGPCPGEDEGELPPCPKPQ